MEVPLYTEYMYMALVSIFVNIDIHSNCEDVDEQFPAEIFHGAVLSLSSFPIV